jgi:hypothetical protein
MIFGALRQKELQNITLGLESLNLKKRLGERCMELLERLTLFFALRNTRRIVRHASFEMLSAYTDMPCQGNYVKNNPYTIVPTVAIAENARTRERKYFTISTREE